MLSEIKNYYGHPPRKTKIALAIVLALVGIIALPKFYAFAQSIIDSFGDTTKIAATWNVEVSTSTGEVKLASRSCNVTNYFCDASTTCSNTLGDGEYIIVAQTDAPTNKQWKTSNTVCEPPLCNLYGGQDGDNLVADNSLDFTDYPARDYCKSIGGRLPTTGEITCIYSNRAIFGNNFSSNNYFTSTEQSTGAAWTQNSGGGFNVSDKNDGTRSVRCVIGW